MNILHKEDIIPSQEKGNASDITATHTCKDAPAARLFFEKVKRRLLNVNEWGSVAGPASARFTLCDAEGNEVQRLVQPNDHFKIDIPGPGPLTGDGYDWVKVEIVDEDRSEDKDTISIRVRPAPNPTNDHSDVAHFFSESATSSFIIERSGTDVTAGVYGRNEKPNGDAEKIIDKARNTAIAAVAITAFSKIQWKGLVEGLVRD
jgi:hypothetical protein